MSPDASRGAGGQTDRQQFEQIREPRRRQIHRLTDTAIRMRVDMGGDPAPVRPRRKPVGRRPGAPDPNTGNSARNHGKPDIPSHPARSRHSPDWSRNPSCGRMRESPSPSPMRPWPAICPAPPPQDRAQSLSRITQPDTLELKAAQGEPVQRHEQRVSVPWTAMPFAVGADEIRGEPGHLAKRRNLQRNLAKSRLPACSASRDATAVRATTRFLPAPASGRDQGRNPPRRARRDTRRQQTDGPCPEGPEWPRRSRGCVRIRRRRRRDDERQAASRRT